MEIKSAKKLILTISKIDSNPLLKWVVIPLLLLIFWLTLSLLINPLEGFTVVSRSYSEKNLKDISLKKDQSISGTFVASENNLGIISFQYANGNVSHSELEDYLLFKIAIKGEKPFYTRTAKLGSVKVKNSLVFGFPKIADSNGKEFMFQLSSLNGNQQNAVTIERSGTFFHAKYQFNKTEILSSNSSFLHFFAKKITGFLQNAENLKATNYYLLPFFFYMIWVLFIRKAIFNNKLLPSVVLFVVLLDCFFVTSTLEITVFAVVDLWIVTLIRNKYRSKTTFVMSGVFLSTSLLFAYLGESSLVNKLSSWSFIFIAIGMLQLLIEESSQSIALKLINRLKRSIKVYLL